MGIRINLKHMFGTDFEDHVTSVERHLASGVAVDSKCVSSQTAVGFEFFFEKFLF